MRPKATEWLPNCSSHEISGLRCNAVSLSLPVGHQVSSDELEAAQDKSGAGSLVACSGRIQKVLPDGRVTAPPGSQLVIVPFGDSIHIGQV